MHASLLKLFIEGTPSYVSEALKSPKWKVIMVEEMQALETNKT